MFDFTHNWNLNEQLCIFRQVKKFKHTHSRQAIDISVHGCKFYIH